MDIFQRTISSLDQPLGSSTRQQEGYYRSPLGRKSSAASPSNDTTQSTTPLPTHNSVQRPPEKAESGTSPSGVSSQGSVSGSGSTVDKTQSTAKQSTSSVLGCNVMPDTNTERPSSAPPIAPGNSISTSLTDSLPHVSPKDFPGADVPEAYGIGPLTSGTSYDTRARGPDGGMRPINKMPTVPSPLRRNGTPHADNIAMQASAIAPRDRASSQFDTVSSQTTQPPRSGAFMHHNVTGGVQVTASLPCNDSLESQTVSSQVTRSPGVSSPLRGSGTSDATAVGAQVPSSASPNNIRSHRPNPASRQTTQSSMVVSSYTDSTDAQVLTSASPDDARVRESDTTIRRATQSPRATSSLHNGGALGSGSTGVHIQAPGTPPGVHSDELDCVPSRAMEIPPTPEHQNYRTRPNPLKKDSITSDELLSKDTEPSYCIYPSTAPEQATELQQSIEKSDQEQSDTPNDELQDSEPDDSTTEDIIIATIGPTGAGKSSFIAKATGNGDEGVGHLLTPCTVEIKATRCMIEGSNVVLVDTPGFDTRGPCLDALALISNWLNSTYRKSTLLSGVLYFHRISDNCMAGTPLKNPRVFQKLCGTKDMSQVVLVTTMWDEVEDWAGNESLEELKDNIWKPMIARGSTMYRHLNTAESSIQLLLHLVDRKRGQVRLQKQIAGKDLEFQETDAGRELYTRSDQMMEKRAEILAAIAAQKYLTADQATVDDLRKQYYGLEAELDEMIRQMQVPKLQRAARYIRYKIFKITGRREAPRSVVQSIEDMVKDQVDETVTPVQTGHSERCSTLPSEQARKVEMKAHLDASIRVRRVALECIPLTAPSRRPILVGLRDDLYQRFKWDGDMTDLAQVIMVQRTVLELTPKNPDRLSALANLIDRLSDRFRIERKGNDLDEMITLQQAALSSIPSDHPDHRSTLVNLAGLLSQRFSREKMTSDLDLGISLGRTALELTPLEASDRHSVLHHLVDLLCGRFREHGAKEDLDEIITLTRALLESTPPGDPGRRPTLLRLASHLSERFKQEGALEDLTEIILTQRVALRVTPPDYPDRCATLANLADCLSARFKRNGDKADLDEIISLKQVALECMLSGDIRRRSMLVSLSDCTYQRFRREGSMADLTETIVLQRAVLELTGPGHADYCSALISCAASLSERFKKEGAIADLNEIIALQRAALNITQDDPQRPQILAQLDGCLYERFRKKGVMADLEEIIALRRAALERTPRADQCRLLLNLASCFHEKFQKLGSVTDIEEAVELGQRALALSLPGHPDHTLSRDCLTKYLAAKIRKRDPRLPVARTGTSSSFLKQLIKNIVFETLENIPLRLLHTSTGSLCNRDAQLSHFEASLQYSQLLLSISALDAQPREAKIRAAVSKFFQYVMLSHRWGSSEPLLREIEGTKVYNLGGTDGLAKLQEFCLRALSRGFTWAWSDTCCIDKDSSAELQEAIGSMFSWYRRSSLTLVYLSDVFDVCSPADSVWFKRGWTLQELLASPTTLFYTQDWSLCMNRDVENHKTDPTMLAELQKATGIAEPHLGNFFPGMDEARSRLQWSSGRRTTRPEDVAYSLFGIFKLHLPVLYGETAESALSRLLGEIISRSGDISVLNWVGRASSIHSCFPADLAPYTTLPCMPSTFSDASRRDGVKLGKVQGLYSSLAKLPLARFVNQRLMLTSIVHWVTTVQPLNRSACVYEIHASHLRPLKVTLSVSLENASGAYVLVRPWHPKSLAAQADTDIDAPWKLVKQLEQPFNALLLKRLPHNEYKRIASDCEIVARVQDLDSVLASEVLTLEIV